MKSLAMIVGFLTPLTALAIDTPVSDDVKHAAREPVRAVARSLSNRGGYESCGGINGNACPMGFFCKLAPGKCCCDFQGVCVPIPDACPENYDPVCGCDGMTYDNECFAHAAGVSIEHEGPCEAAGTCCFDVTDGPIEYESCEQSTAEQCANLGGVFWNANDGCADLQPCCLPSPAGSYCAEGIAAGCCELSGGQPLGPNGVCNNTCGSVCGGILGIPCENPNEYCKLPTGFCCCDFQGVCTTIPQGCPDVWEPVCGCDGMTYGNECEAEAASVSIDYDGECQGICEPVPDGYGCLQNSCSDVPEIICRQAKIHLDISSGALTTLECDCANMNECHIEFGNASPFAVGICSDNTQSCQVVGEDTDNDGIDDTFSAACLPNNQGTCCLDVTDGPIQYESCEQTTADQCANLGGVFWNANDSCANLQPCCLQSPAGSYCAEGIAAGCCELSGGQPLGPNTVCDNTCGDVCGGILGIPCENPNEYCKLPTGFCCCDFQGVCTMIPQGCPDVWEPVCGCDGMTYGNECEAEAAGVSINYEGACITTCQPAANGLGCSQDACSAIPEDRCQQTLIHLDIETGGLTTLACDCFDMSACHIEFGNASPFAVGNCPDNTQSCEVIAEDTDNDGQPDTFSAGCFSSNTGTCCLDVTDGPVPFETCETSTEDVCAESGGIFWDASDTCANVQPCCLPLPIGNLCVNGIAAGCCEASGGIPLGPNGVCNNNADCP